MSHRIRALSPSGAFACLLISACSQSAPEDPPLLGSSAQAISRGADRHDRERSRHGHEHRRGQGHGHDGDCDESPEMPEVPDPIAFTPAAAAARIDRRAGTAVLSGALAQESIYAQLVAEQFTDLTPENEMKWGSLQPNGPNTWVFEPADAIVDFAAEHELQVKGHTLIWHQQLPSFINADTTDNQLARYAERHIERTARHFARDVYGWDVVNEAIADDGSGLRSTPFSDAFGERYIDRAFRLAHQADRNAQLFYNDYGIESINAKSDAVLALLGRLLDRHVPVDGVGLQAHLDARFAPSFDELVANFQRFADLGLRLNISELDVRVAGLGGSRAFRLAVQKQIYQRVAAACASVDACEGVTTWGFTDAHSWVDATFGPDDPLLFDDNYQKKPAYFGYVDGFLGVPLDDPTLPPNLIGNSSLEAGLDGWSVMGSAALATEVDAAHTGLRSVRASGRAATWQGPRHDVSALVAGARSYTASVWTRLSGAASADATLTAQVSCAGQDPVFLPIATAAASDAGWTELAGRVSLPSCELASAALYVEGPEPGVDLLVDDLALREAPQPNAIGNPDFESGYGGWFGFGPVTLGVTSDAHAGAAAAIATGRTDTWNGIATDLTASVSAGASYHAEAWLKIAGAASDAVRLTAAVGCADGTTQFLPVGSALGSATDWAFVSGTVIAPSCSIQSFVLYAEGPAAGVDLLMDDAAFWLLEEAPPPPAVIENGDFESGSGGWFGFGPVSVAASSERAHGGSQSGHVSGRTDTWNGMAVSLLGRLTPGASYTVSAWAQVGSGSHPVNLTFQNACDGGATNFSFIAGATASDAAWTQLQGTLVAPNCALTTANFYIEGAPAGVDIYLDDVEVAVAP